MLFVFTESYRPIGLARKKVVLVTMTCVTWLHKKGQNKRQNNLEKKHLSVLLQVEQHNRKKKVQSS